MFNKNHNKFLKSPTIINSLKIKSFQILDSIHLIYIYENAHFSFIYKIVGLGNLKMRRLKTPTNVLFPNFQVSKNSEETWIIRLFYHFSSTMITLFHLSIFFLFDWSFYHFVCFVLAFTKRFLFLAKWPLFQTFDFRQMKTFSLVFFYGHC